MGLDNLRHIVDRHELLDNQEIAGIRNQAITPMQVAWNNVKGKTASECKIW